MTMAHPPLARKLGAFVVLSDIEMQVMEDMHQRRHPSLSAQFYSQRKPDELICSNSIRDRAHYVQQSVSQHDCHLAWKVPDRRDVQFYTT